MRTALRRLALFSVILSAFSVARAQAQPPWLNPAWAFRSPVSVTNPAATSLTEFQVHVVLDASFDFTKARSDGGDVRFTAADGTTLLPSWTESWNPATTSASLWVRVPSLPVGGTTIYLYFGNPSAASASDGAATFDFFDDFESSLSFCTLPSGTRLGEHRAADLSAGVELDNLPSSKWAAAQGCWRTRRTAATQKPKN